MMTNSLDRFTLYFEHQESVEEYNELMNRTPNRIAAIMAPIFVGQLSK